MIVMTEFSCSDSKAEHEARISALSTSVESFDQDLQDVAVQVRALSSDLGEIADAYERVSSHYRDARQHRLSAQAESNASVELLKEAAKNWDQAAASWRFYRTVLKIAISIDQARAASPDGLDRSISCEPVSTASYRRRLIAQGISLLGKDIDHIVPRALGGQIIHGITRF